MIRTASESSQCTGKRFCEIDTKVEQRIATAKRRSFLPSVNLLGASEGKRVRGKFLFAFQLEAKFQSTPPAPVSRKAVGGKRFAWYG